MNVNVSTDDRGICLTVLPCGHKHYIGSDHAWSRVVSKKAKDLICSKYKVNRKAIVFKHLQPVQSCHSIQSDQVQPVEHMGHSMNTHS